MRAIQQNYHINVSAKVVSKQNDYMIVKLVEQNKTIKHLTY